MKKIILRLSGTLLSCFLSVNAYAYPVAKVHNNTEYTIGGHVNYASALCSDDYYKVKPGKTWTAKSRGACLITSVTGKAHTTNGKSPSSSKVTKYHSSGTSYSKFYIINEKGNHRIVSSHQLKGDSAQSYPLARVVNHSLKSVHGTVSYASAFCSDDSYNVGPAKEVKGKLVPTTWMAKSRGVCLVDKITGKLSDGKHVKTYTSSGTSYGTFEVRPTQTGYRMFSEGEYKKHQDAQHGKSPGFYIHNKTDWPLAISLNQLGCLYYDVVDSGEVFKRDTGAVWFTIKANIQPDGKLPQSDWDCIKPVAVVVGTALVTAATGGYGAFAATSLEGAGAVAAIATSTAVTVTGGAVSGLLTGGALTSLGTKVLGDLFTDNGTLALEGQYAGYEWPFRCDVMPTYEITGGPSLEYKDGKAVLGVGKTFTLKKINSCGDNMMHNTKATAPNTINWDEKIAEIYKK